jgi:hypothetical protein
VRTNKEIDHIRPDAHEKPIATAAATTASQTPDQPLEQTVSASILPGMMPGSKSAARIMRRRIDRNQCGVDRHGAYIGTAEPGVKR